ncbi:hypothetical protein PMAYCL1PPCAC_16956, partial [Pristionchus mayeri]
RNFAPSSVSFIYRSFATPVASSSGIRQLESMLGYIPEQEKIPRVARVFQKPSCTTKVWKIEVDNGGCLENDMVGHTPTDPLSDASQLEVHRMQFRTKEEALALCGKNNWAVVLEDEGFSSEQLGCQP